MSISQRLIGVEVNSGVSGRVYDSMVINGLHEELQLHMLMVLDSSQRQQGDSAECVSHVSTNKTGKRCKQKVRKIHESAMKVKKYLRPHVKN